MRFPYLLQHAPYILDEMLAAPIDTPKILLSWDSAMMMAAALVNPTMTGWDRKLTTTRA